MNGGGIPPRPTKVNITSKFSFTYDKKIVGREGNNLGEMVAASGHSVGASNYVNIRQYSKLQISVIQLNNPSSDAGGCFYDENRLAISGFCFAELPPRDNVVKEIDIPIGAVYVRSTSLKDADHDFSCYGIGVIL